MPWLLYTSLSLPLPIFTLSGIRRTEQYKRCFFCCRKWLEQFSQKFSIVLLQLSFWYNLIFKSAHSSTLCSESFNVVNLFNIDNLTKHQPRYIMFTIVCVMMAASPSWRVNRQRQHQPRTPSVCWYKPRNQTQLVIDAEMFLFRVTL